MQEFYLKSNASFAIHRKDILRSLPLVIIYTGIAIFVSYNQEGSGFQYTGQTIVTLLIFITVVAFGIYRGLKRKRVLQKSYVLTVTNDFVKREQYNTPTMLIHANEIDKIYRTANGGFFVKPKKSAEPIIIPPTIDRAEELENALRQLGPFDILQKTPFYFNYQIALGIVQVILMFCVLASQNKIIVLGAGTLIIALLTWSLFRVYKTKLLDSKTKKSLWWSVVVIAAVLAAMIKKLQ